MSGPDDFFLLESRITERIEAQIPELAGAVHALGALDDMFQGARQEQVFLFPGQASFDADRAGRAVDVRQRWMVILTVRNVAGMRSGRPARRAGGPLLSRLIMALAGWHPGSPLGLLRIVTPGMKPFWANGVLVYPLEFETAFAYSAKTPLPGVNR